MFYSAHNSHIYLEARTGQKGSMCSNHIDYIVYDKVKHFLHTFLIVNTIIIVCHS